MVSGLWSGLPNFSCFVRIMVRIAKIWRREIEIDRRKKKGQMGEDIRRCVTVDWKMGRIVMNEWPNEWPIEGIWRIQRMLSSSWSCVRAGGLLISVKNHYSWKKQNCLFLMHCSNSMQFVPQSLANNYF